MESIHFDTDVDEKYTDMSILIVRKRRGGWDMHVRGAEMPNENIPRVQGCTKALLSLFVPDAEAE